jgi:hypothetical protein
VFCTVVAGCTDLRRDAAAAAAPVVGIGANEDESSTAAAELAFVVARVVLFAWSVCRVGFVATVLRSSEASAAFASSTRELPGYSFTNS